MDTMTPETRAEQTASAARPGLTVAHCRIAAGAGETLCHREGADIAIVVAGAGTVTLDGSSHPLASGDVLLLEDAPAHAVRGTGPGDLELVTLGVQPARPDRGRDAPRLHHVADGDFEPAFGVEVAHIGDVDGAAFTVGLAYARIVPGGATTPHHHDETEAFLVLDGDGAVVVSGAAHPLQTGAFVEVEPFEDHELRNTGDRDLLLVDLFWRDPVRAAARTRPSARVRFGDRPVFIFSSPPTPNGDLHLGHLSGPYLGADVYRRFQRMRGVDARHVVITDDFQAYVAERARREGTTPQAIAARHADEIRATLAAMDVPLDDTFGTSSAAGYREGLVGFVERIAAAPGVEVRPGPALLDGATGAYLFEADISGACPTCDAPTGGNMCEECGEPNRCVDLVDPRSAVSDAAPRAEQVARLSVPMHEFGDLVRDHYRRGRATPRLQELAHRVFAKPELHLAITHPFAWGVPAPAPAPGGQVIWTWVGVAYAFLYAAERLGRQSGREWSSLDPRPEWRIVHFFGYDNSFYHTMFIPVLYALAFPDWEPDIEYHVNEFYLLDSEKFSTSRRHAIWGRDVLNADTVDPIRHHLALTRGEVARTNFQLEDVRRTTEETLVGVWQCWLADLGRRVADGFGGAAPDAGSWSPQQRAFLGLLQARLDRISVYYDADGFALNDVVREIDGLVEDAARFARVHATLAGDPDVADEHRTAIALELTAALLLAQVTAPVMPRFSARLAAALGRGPIETWPDVVTLVPYDTTIDLAGTVFFHAGALGVDAGAAVG